MIYEPPGKDRFDRAYNSDLVWGIGIGAGVVGTYAFRNKLLPAAARLASGAKNILPGIINNDSRVLKAVGKGAKVSVSGIGKGMYNAYTWDPFADKAQNAVISKAMKANKHGFWGAFEPNQRWYRMTTGQSLAQAGKSALGNALRTIPIVGGGWASLDLGLSALSDNPYKTWAQSTAGAVAVPLGARLGYSVGSFLGGGIIPKAGLGLAGLGIGLAVGSFVDIAQGIASYGRDLRNNAFGGGHGFQDSLGASTMRQASLMAIRNSELNNRNFILGNEARMLTNNF